MAGIQTIKQKLEQMEIAVCDDNVTKIIHYVKSKEKGTVSDNEILEILNDNELQGPMFQ